MDTHQNVCTLCNRAQDALETLQTKRRLLEQQQIGLQDALRATDLELAAARAALSVLKIALGQAPLERALPPGIE
jgi:hypothetical protein